MHCKEQQPRFHFCYIKQVCSDGLALLCQAVLDSPTLVSVSIGPLIESLYGYIEIRVKPRSCPTLLFFDLARCNLFKDNYFF